MEPTLTMCRWWWSLHFPCVGGGGAYTYHVQVVVEPLYPPELASLSVADFMAKLPSLDAGFAQRVASATSAGKVWRHPRPPYVLTALCTRPQLPTDDAVLRTTQSPLTYVLIQMCRLSRFTPPRCLWTLNDVHGSHEY